MHRPERNPRIAAPLVGALALAGGLGCEPSRSVERTVDGWSTDRFASSATALGASRRAARILDVPDEPIAVPVPMQVGSAVTVLFDRPDAFGNAVAQLPEGAAVRGEVKSAFMHRPAEWSVDGGFAGDPFPTWVRVSAGSSAGWISARSLVDPMLRARGADALAASLRDGVARPGAPLVPILLTSTPRRSGADYAAADGMLAVAARPPRFRPATDDVFAWGGRNDRLPSAGLPLDRLDPECATRAAAVRDESAEIRPATFYPKAPGDLWGAITLGLGPKAGAALAVDELVTMFMARHPISSVEERVLGRECLAAMLGGRSAIPFDDPVSCYVNWVGNRLAACSSSPLPSLGFLFIVVDEDAPSLQAVPGGPVLVTSGLLRTLANEHELAAVLACGVAHVEARHGAEAAMGAGGDEWSSVLQVHALDAAGVLEAVIAAGLKEVPEEYLDGAMKRARAELLAKAGNGFEATVTGALEAVRSPPPEHALAAGVRATTLLAAGGWAPSAVVSVLTRYPGAGLAVDDSRLDVLRRAVASVTAGSGLRTPRAVVGERWRRFESIRRPGRPG